MIEIELKYKVKPAKISDLRSRLKRLGAKVTERKLQIDTYYSPPHQTFLGRERYLRVRENRVAGEVYGRLEYHVPYGNYAAREYEIKVSDIKLLYFILKQLGFVVELVVRKQREEWHKGSVEVEIDKVRGLGAFAELEVKGGRQAEVLKRIEALAEKFGLKRSDRVEGAYFKQLLKKQRPVVWRKYYGKTKR